MIRLDSSCFPVDRTTIVVEELLSNPPRFFPLKAK